MGFFDDMDFSFNFDPYNNADYSNGIGGGGGGGGFSYEPPIPTPQAPRTPQNNYGSPSGSDFLNTYRNLGGRVPGSVDPVDYINYDSDEWKNYANLARSRPESENIINNYVNSMPTREQYEPGTGRKIAGFLLGTLAGFGNPSLAGSATTKFLDAPYLDAFADWKNKGSYVSTEARLADAARGRELQSLKYGIDKGIAERRSQALDKQKADDYSLRLAGQMEGNEKAAAKLAEQQAHNEMVQKAREAANEATQARLELERTRVQNQVDEFNRLHGPGSSKESNDLIHNILNFASISGVPEKFGSKEEGFQDITANQAAHQIAIREMIQKNPQMKQFFTADPSGQFYMINDPRVQYGIEQRVKQILAGQFK